MTVGPSDPRHLSTSVLLMHLAGDVEVIYPFPGDPEVFLQIDGAHQTLTLWAELRTEIVLPPSPLARIKTSIAARNSRRFLTVTASDAGLLVECHRMMCAVADRIQLDAVDPVEALTLILRSWGEVLALRTRWSREQEVGLFGELLLFKALAVTDAGVALAAWRAAENEEHDFGLAKDDIEVKTTSGEKREHWISSLTQLVPTGSRPLWLASFQVTRAGAGGGRTLPDLVEDVKALLDAPGREVFSDKLDLLGWDASSSDLFPDAWRLRNAPVAFRVAEGFPRITPSELELGGVALEFLREVRYKLDLTQVDVPEQPAGPFRTALSSFQEASV